MRSAKAMRLLCLFSFVFAFGLLGLACNAETLVRVKVPVASVTAQPNSKSEQVTQVLLWDEVKVLERRPGWAKVLVPEQYRTDQGYPGWIKVSDITSGPVSGSPLWVTVAYPWVALRKEPNIQAEVATQAYMSTRLPVLGQGTGSVRRVGKEDWHEVALPEGGSAWIRVTQVRPEAEPSAAKAAEIVAEATRLEGTPYLWGGMSRIGIDCSGLVYVAYRMNGVTLPRDADQQFEIGEAVKPEELSPGDLVFFGESDADITHVGIYAGDGNIVHASSGSGVVVSALFEGWYKEMYRGARRVLKGSGGGTRVLTPSP